MHEFDRNNLSSLEYKCNNYDNFDKKEQFQENKNWFYSTLKYISDLFYK